jgi:hypothetical protein
MHFERAQGVAVVGGDEDDRDLRVEQLQDLEAVELGHLDVEEHHLRLELGRRLHRFQSRRRLTHDLDVGLRGEHLAEEGPRRGLVVHEQHADHSTASAGIEIATGSSPLRARPRRARGRRIPRAAPAHVGQPTPTPGRGGRLRIERVLHADAHALTVRAGLDAQYAAVGAGGDAVPDRVLDEGCRRRGGSRHARAASSTPSSTERRVPSRIASMAR